MKPWRHTFVANGVILASGLASGVIAARLLGPEDRGLLAAVIFWPHFVAGVAAMGLNESIAIRTAKHGSTASLRATVVALSLALALPLGLIGVLALPILLSEARQSYVGFAQVYFVTFLPLTFLAMNLLAIEQGELQFRAFNLQRVLQAIAYPVFLIGLWATGYLSVRTAAIAVLSSAGVVALIRLWRSRRALRHRPSTEEAKGLLRQGLKLHATNLVMSLSMQLDKTALVLFSTDTQLGLYVVTITAASVTPALFVQTYINIMLPTAAKLGPGAQHIEGILAPLRKLLALVIISTLGLLVVLPIALPVVFGSEYSAAVSYARILAIAFAFAEIKRVFHYVLRSWSLHRLGVRAEGITAVLLAVGAYPALHLWGVMGLSMVVLISHAIGAAILIRFFLNEAGLKVSSLWSTADAAKLT